MRNNITQPAIENRHSKAITGPFIFSTVASHAPPMVAMSWTAPKGILKRIVLNWSKPKDSIIRGPKVDMPPLGSLACEHDTTTYIRVIGETYDIANISTNQNHVFRSRQASLTWSHFHWLFSTPCWFIRSLHHVSIYPWICEITPEDAPLNCNKLILFLEKLGSHRRVRHKAPENVSFGNSVRLTGPISQYNCRKCDRNETEEQEDYLSTLVFQLPICQRV